MAINSTFYDGTVDEVAFSTGISRVGASEYGVAGPGDLKVTAVSGVDRTISIAAGAAWGKGIHDVLTAAQTITLPSVTSGNRWDVIVAHRVWATNTTTLIRIAGSSTRVIPSRSIGYGTTDDQPIALVRVTSGSTSIQEIIDLRCWAANGGMVAVDDLALSYLTRVGGRVQIDGTDWVCSISSLGSAQWATSAVVGKLPLFGLGPSITNPNAPAGTYFLIQAGSLVQKTDLNGYGRITWPKPFPNGLVTVMLTNGDDASDGKVSFVVVAGRTNVYGQSGLGSKTDVVYALLSTTDGGSGALMPSSMARVNYIAIGW